MRHLISGRIYELPTGERIAALKVADAYWFYDPETRFTAAPRYATDSTGRIADGRTARPTAWIVDDLIDTGEDMPR